MTLPPLEGLKLRVEISLKGGRFCFGQGALLDPLLQNFLEVWTDSWWGKGEITQT